MKSLVSLIAVAIFSTLVKAQTDLQYNGTFTCPIPNGTYCISDSLQSPIIVRCLNNTGHVGNCNDNLAGAFPPTGFATCWASSPISGIAACAKNCIVYGASGNSGNFTLPGCIPSATPSISLATASLGVANSYNGSMTRNRTAVPTYASSGFMPFPTNGTAPIGNSTAVSTGLKPFPTNGTESGSSSGSPGSSGSDTSAAGSSSAIATATPKSPPSTTIPVVPTFTGAAGTLHAGSAIAALGFLFVAFL